MANMRHTIITGTGSYIPRQTITNTDFLENTFLNTDGTPLEKDNKETIKKFTEITGIEQRRYADDGVVASDMGAEAGKNALRSANIDPEKLDYIIVAHNFGDIRADTQDHERCV